jgi:deoxyribodipyrimidine photolyase-related protein
MPKTLRLILGDQLNKTISSLNDIDKDNDVILMCEVWDEATYVKHHKKKIAFLFSAMRHFAAELKNFGFNVDYIQLDDEGNSGSFKGEVKRAIDRHNVNKMIVTEASEYRVLKDMRQWADEFGIKVEIRPDDRFLATHKEFKEWAEDGRKQLRMEYFYRTMRRKHDVLMDGDDPVGGQWNYDAENRKPPKDGLDIPQTYTAQVDEITQDVMDLIADRFGDHFGDLEPFYFAVTRDQALYALNKFIDERLCAFGDYQDAMVEGEPWMYHSHISFYMNCGLLLPIEVIRKAEEAYDNGDAPLNAVEGFIRQILGWREFIRGVYWYYMPDYADMNALNATRALPEFMWTGQTKMNCMRQCIAETRQNAYAHHIQRLMVLGNFLLLAGVDPKHVNEWYLIVYADAYEWVEMPNVTGMILHADDGIVGSKPYAASASYINKMSDYCKNCSYSPTKKNGKDACPFNYLYWNFHLNHQVKFENNPRIGFAYKTLSRMNDEKIDAIKSDSERFFKAMDAGDVV